MGSGVLQKTTVIYHSLLLHQEMQLESLLLEEKAIHTFYAAMLLGPLGQSSSQIVKKTVKMCALLRWVHISTCFQEKRILSFQSQRPKGPSRLSLATEAKANVCHGMGVQQSKPHGWLAYVRRYYWHGGIYWDCTEMYTAIKMMSFMLSPWLLYQDNARSHSACATTAWFCRQSECVRLASRSVSYWKCMTSHEKENQTMMITDCWASEVLYQARLGKHFTCNTLKISILYSQTMKHCK